LRVDRVREIDFTAVDARSQSLLRHITVKLLQSFTDRDRRRNLR
jgi:hypothetical protein